MTTEDKWVLRLWGLLLVILAYALLAPDSPPTPNQPMRQQYEGFQLH
jgi:hypothetical protein